MQVLQNVEKLPCGVILLLDISQTEEIVMSEVTRLKRVLCDYSHANLSQVKSVMVPAAALNAVSSINGHGCECDHVRPYVHTCSTIDPYSESMVMTVRLREVST